MCHYTEHDSPAVIETKQGEDTFLHAPIREGVIARLRSVRCLEAQMGSLPCQDYAKVLSNQQGTSLCFCVSDGVGSSFNAELAARYLATELVAWLQTLSTIPEDVATLSLSLHPRLEQWASTAQGELEKLALPAETPLVVRKIVQQGRQTRGSETVFLGGRIDYDPRASSGTSSQARVLFCWMGNVTAYLFTPTHKPMTLGDQNNDTNRWSTLHGCCGSLTLVSFLFDGLDRLIIHTDGLDTVGQALAHLDDDEVEERIQQLLRLPKNDDMTVLDLQWMNTPFADGDAL